MAKTNSTKSLTDADLSLQIKHLQTEIANEKKVKVSIPAVFQSQLGPSLFVGVNGNEVIIPVDGEEHLIPETLANHVKEYIKGLK